MSRPRTYLLDEEYFNKPLNDNGAYLLGLILSDGSYSIKGGGSFSYACVRKDIELINFIKKEFNSNHPIKNFPHIKETGKYIRYSFNNKKLINSLVKNFNLPAGNKSQNNLFIPKQIPDKLLHHFLRGIFDGDGSIWRAKGDSWQIAFCGGKNFLEQIKKILEKETDVKFRLRYRYSKENLNSCSIETKGTFKVNSIYEYLYKDACFSLKRKEEKFKQCKIEAEKSFKRLLKFNGKEKEIEKLYKEGIKQCKISKLLDIGYSTVRGCVQRLRKLQKII